MAEIGCGERKEMILEEEITRQVGLAESRSLGKKNTMCQILLYIGTSIQYEVLV